MARDYDKAIRALRAEALAWTKIMTHASYHWLQAAGIRAAAYSYAADYLASITGKLEQAAGKRPRRSRASRSGSARGRPKS